jgi:hypothetical protein
MSEGLKDVCGLLGPTVQTEDTLCYLGSCVCEVRFPTDLAIQLLTDLISWSKNNQFGNKITIFSPLNPQFYESLICTPGLSHK